MLPESISFFLPFFLFNNLFTCSKRVAQRKGETDLPCTGSHPKWQQQLLYHQLNSEASGFICESPIWMAGCQVSEKHSGCFPSTLAGSCIRRWWKSWDSNPHPYVMLASQNPLSHNAGPNSKSYNNKNYSSLSQNQNLAIASLSPYQVHLFWGF